MEKIEEKKTLPLESIEDVKLQVSVNVGYTQKMVVEILAWKEGDVIALDKNIEEYIDIKLNGENFAIGEIVVANEKYGVRIVDLA